MVCSVPFVRDRVGLRTEMRQAHQRLPRRCQINEKAKWSRRTRHPWMHGIATNLKWTAGTPQSLSSARHDVVLQIGSPQKLIDHFAKSFIETRLSVWHPSLRWVYSRNAGVR